MAREQSLEVTQLYRSLYHIVTLSTLHGNLFRAACSRIFGLEGRPFGRRERLIFIVIHCSCGAG